MTKNATRIQPRSWTTLLVLVLAGCSNALRSEPPYRMEVISIAGPGAAEMTQGKDGTAEDAQVALRVTPAAGTFGLMVRNKTAEPIAIVWEESSVVWDGRSGSVVRGAIADGVTDQVQPPTQIPPGSAVQEVIIPREHVDTARTAYRDWVPDGVTVTETVPGQLIVPLRIGGVTREYVASFEMRPPAAVR